MSSGIPRHRPKFASVVFDADSTLSALEGIDWLGALRGPQVAADIEALTNRAMDGLVPLDDVYAERIARIRPTAHELQRLGEVYVERVLPGAAELIAALHAAGVQTMIVSGGIREALLPLAAHLGIPDSRVHAVTLRASADTPARDHACDIIRDRARDAVREDAHDAVREDAHDDAREDAREDAHDDVHDVVHDDVRDALDGAQLLATQAGKVRLVESLIAAGTLAAPIAMVGDGATDAAVRGVVDTFIAFTGVVRRDAVVAAAAFEVEDMRALREILFE